jgi:hypothetical protein
MMESGFFNFFSSPQQEAEIILISQKNAMVNPNRKKQIGSPPFCVFISLDYSRVKTDPPLPCIKGCARKWAMKL